MSALGLALCELYCFLRRIYWRCIRFFGGDDGRFSFRQCLALMPDRETLDQQQGWLSMRPKDFSRDLRWLHVGYVGDGENTCSAAEYYQNKFGQAANLDSLEA